MSSVHEIQVTPASKREMEVLNDITTEFDAAREGGQAAVFGQLWVEGRIGRLKASVLSGDAMSYLHEHLLIALEMQERAK